MSARSIFSSLARQQPAIAAFAQQSIRREQCRLFRTSAMALTTAQQQQQQSVATDAEKVTRKFVDHVRKNRNFNKREPTRFIQIDSLPMTATSEDIRKLAREALPDGDKAIQELLFVRDDYFEFDGRCMLEMKTAEDAQRVIEYGNRRMIGGNVLRLSHIDKLSDKMRRNELNSVGDVESAAGRSVMVVGFPTPTKPEHLLGYLRSRNFYPAEGSLDNVIKLKTRNQATVSKFLVKFDSESEAWRAVRMFHNTDFFSRKRNENYKLQVSVVY
ncbi:hypothetical protein RO3G_08365 [Lichtheimia corymbifera JMRC:FSU:9682]|uniref:RRM domain-containing protein n=1 Tax=Lichtheimia corymbifera JMRC:FSU:9682 TaxID=1263082 RepID=A0A068RFZ3_9FUNG|nr:hypothetical protein RO3G_08365 [Lichtheimia corymbifera JMRC:FSU:9682]